MGILRRKGAGGRGSVHLEGETVVGRWSGSHLRIDRAGVSARHAMIRWTSFGWTLRDLGSHNGTLHNGKHVLPSAAAPLAVGDELTFGELDEVWVVDDVGSPGLVLWPLEGEISPIRVSAADGLQAFPSPEEPTAMVLLRGTGQWSLEFLTGQRVELVHGAVVTLLGRRWRCEVSAAADETAESSRPIHAFSLATVSLTIRVAPDEETAELQVRGGALERPVGPSVPLYSLAYLARRRLRDGAELAAAGSAPDDSPLSQAGWVATESACRDLRLSREQLGVHVYRVRDVLKGIGLADAADVIERRRGWLRIGVDSGRLAVA